jgi:hypothetical protein
MQMALAAAAVPEASLQQPLQATAPVAVSHSGVKRKKADDSKKSAERVANACVECNKSKVKCEGIFPCKRCVAKKMGDTCCPKAHGKPGPKTSHKRQKEDASASSSSSSSQAPPPPLKPKEKAARKPVKRAAAADAAVAYEARVAPPANSTNLAFTTASSSSSSSAAAAAAARAFPSVQSSPDMSLQEYMNVPRPDVHDWTSPSALRVEAANVISGYGHGEGLQVFAVQKYIQWKRAAHVHTAVNEQLRSLLETLYRHNVPKAEVERALEDGLGRAQRRVLYEPVSSLWPSDDKGDSDSAISIPQQTIDNAAKHFDINTDLSFQSDAPLPPVLHGTPLLTAIPFL